MYVCKVQFFFLSLLLLFPSPSSFLIRGEDFFFLDSSERKELLDDVASVRWNALSAILDRPSSGFRDNAYAYHFLSISSQSAITMSFLPSF
ncbi:hypothetical protein B9Z19DRAFT_1071021 [Tuber borchii]|uniref:Uncharacterized protein n=1 Tax=Tuber borchii TaxID=42251 RepID=A0A2T7A8N7_TUBBO|nr:hypothetical protein B9Z19DRAFT_1071021 [Tuber borchii]